MASSVPPSIFVPGPEAEAPLTQRSVERPTSLSFLEYYKDSARQVRIQILESVGDDTGFRDEENEEDERFLDEDILRRLVGLNSSTRDADDFLSVIDEVFVHDETKKGHKKFENDCMHKRKIRG